MIDQINMTVKVEGEHEDIVGAIVDVAAKRLLESLAGIGEEGEPHYKESALTHRLTKKIDDAISGFVQTIVEEHARRILEMGVPKTNTYGERLPGGQVMTVSEAIAEKLHKEIVERQKNYNNSSIESVLSRIIREQVDSALSKELSNELATAKEKVRSAISSQASKLLTDAVASRVGV